jgi:hypothetical protein
MEKLTAHRGAVAGAAIGLTVAAAATYFVVRRSGSSKVRPFGRFPAESLPDDAYDAVIVGAGPSGSTCAYFLSKAGAKVALLDKETFPRDKYCGDAVRHRAPLPAIRKARHMMRVISKINKHQ